MKWAGVIVLLALGAYGAWSYATDGVMHFALSPSVEPVERLLAIQRFFESWGLAAPVGYVLLVVAEVILAPIPGAVLYLPGGAIFGWVLGGALSLAGNVIGAGLACQIMRSLGRSYLERYLERTSLKKYEQALERRSISIIFLLRVNPLTSSDLISYAAGLTRIPLWKVGLGTLLGMAPLCFIQS